VQFELCLRYSKRRGYCITFKQCQENSGNVIELFSPFANGLYLEDSDHVQLITPSKILCLIVYYNIEKHRKERVRKKSESLFIMHSETMSSQTLKHKR